MKKAVVDQIVLRLLGQDTDIFLSLWHSALNGLITVWYLSFTLILLAPQGLQICNLDHVLYHIASKVLLYYVLSKNYVSRSSLNFLWAANDRVHYHQDVRMHIPFCFE